MPPLANDDENSYLYDYFHKARTHVTTGGREISTQLEKNRSGLMSPDFSLPQDARYF